MSEGKFNYTNPVEPTILLMNLVFYDEVEDEIFAMPVRVADSLSLEYFTDTGGIKKIKWKGRISNNYKHSHLLGTL